jgi:hypothetical protein
MRSSTANIGAREASGPARAAARRPSAASSSPVSTIWSITVEEGAAGRPKSRARRPGLAASDRTSSIVPGEIGFIPE